MKKTIIMLAAMTVALGAAATDRFYIEGFEIAPGETRTVSILLDNEAAYTAFQCDIYMPDGLTIEQEDGDYIFDLTTRKARDHNIASQVQVDGSIRVMSYSPGIKSYSGNSGALVTFNVTTNSDFVGPVSILLKNILFTTVAGIEVPFADENCTVTLRGDVNGDGNVNITDVTALINAVLNDNFSNIIVANSELTGDGIINISDVTALISLVLNS